MLEVKDLKDEDVLTADDIYGAVDESLFAVTVPEWQKNGKPGVLCFRTMTGGEAIQYGTVIKNKQDGAWVNLLALCACDRTGKAIFTADSIEKLRHKNASVFLRLQKKLLQINGLLRTDRTWPQLEAILREASVPDDIVKLVQTKWELPEDEAKKA